MQTLEIPNEQWQPFLETFTNEHRGDRVDVEQVGGGANAQPYLMDRPLLGVLAIPDRQSGTRIQVVAGTESRPETCTIYRPAQLSVTKREDGEPVALEIACDNGRVTSVRVERRHEHLGIDMPPDAFIG